MNASELSKQLNNSEYPLNISTSLCAAAKENGLIIVHGVSDDTIELKGAINDEGYIIDGGLVNVDKKGILSDLDSIRDEA